MYEWLIFYDDGSTFSNLDGRPEDAFVYGVQVIVVPDEEAGRRLIAKFDYYWWDGEWFGSDEAPPTSDVKIGTLVGREEFGLMVKRAKSCDGFPKKVKLLDGEP